MNQEPPGAAPQILDTVPELQELDALQRHIDQFYAPDLADRGPAEPPPFNFWFGRRRILVAGQLTEAVQESLEVVLDDDAIWVRGAMKQNGQVRRGVWLQGPPVRFSRRIDLPYNVQPDSLKATWIEGILIIHAFRLPSKGRKAA